jgi:hypothetical protein
MRAELKLGDGRVFIIDSTKYGVDVFCNNRYIGTSQTDSPDMTELRWFMCGVERVMQPPKELPLTTCKPSMTHGDSTIESMSGLKLVIDEVSMKQHGERYGSPQTP